MENPFLYLANLSKNQTNYEPVCECGEPAKDIVMFSLDGEQHAKWTCEKCERVNWVERKE